MLSSQIKVREAQPAVRQLSAAPTAITGFVGVAERGPINTPTLITSFERYQEIFGGFLANGNRHLQLAVQSFFQEGGGICYVVRTVHHTDVTDPTTHTAEKSTAVLQNGGGESAAMMEGAAYPLNLEPDDVVELAVDGGVNASATFVATAEEVASAEIEPYDLADGQTLTIQIDSGAVQTITFAAADVGNIDAVTAQEAVNTINTQIVGAHAELTDAGTGVKIVSDTRGGGSAVVVTGGTAAAAFGFGESVAGAGNVGNIDAVTAAEAKTVIEIDIAGVVVDADANVLTISTISTGDGASLVRGPATASAFSLPASANGSSNALIDVLRCEEAYGAGLTYSVAVQDATSGDADRFDMVIADEDGLTLEAYRNVSATPDADDYVVDVIAASSRFRATHLGADGDPRPVNQTLSITGGDAGLTDLSDADLVGGSGANGKTGLQALDNVLDLALVAIPGRASATIAAGLNTYVETTRAGKAFAIHDIPEGSSSSGAITYVETTASLLGSAEHGATYWPWVGVANPSQSVFGDGETVSVAPSGVACGVFARVDGSKDGGVYESPAGYEVAPIRSALELANEDVNLKATRDLLYPKRINPIRTAPGRPIYLDGGRTLKAGGNFANVAERRGVSMIMRTIEDGLDFARHRHHDSELRGRIRRTVRAFLLRQMLVGAFRSREEESAFYVICNTTNNPEEVVLAGKVNVRVGLATQKPAEFIEVVISQDTRIT